MSERGRGPMVAALVGAVALAVVAVGLLGGADRPSSAEEVEPASTSAGPLVAEQPRPGTATTAPHEVRLPTTTTPGPLGLPDPAGAPTNVPLTPPAAAVRPVTEADRPPAEVVVDDPDPALPAKAFDLVPSVRTGAGVGRTTERAELVAEDGTRVARATIRLRTPGSWRDIADVFDPIFAAAGFRKVGAAGGDDANLEHRRLAYQRSSMGCHVLYDATLGPYCRVLCAG